MPPITAALQSAHDVIRKYRNTTIARSQSNLALPLPVAFLDAAGQGVNVRAYHLSIRCQRQSQKGFAELINVMEDVVVQATQPVLERLRAWIKDKTPEEIQSWDKPDFVHANDLEFGAAGRTPRFTAYWHTEQSSTDEQLS